LGFVTGGKKGLQKGALMGALTGGVLGARSALAMFGIVKGATSGRHDRWANSPVRR
jgi:hypothetical protein